MGSNIRAGATHYTHAEVFSDGFSDWFDMLGAAALYNGVTHD